jgi:O-antigen ligase
MVVLALYVATTVGRLHEVVPILGRIYLGKLVVLMLVGGLVMDASKLPLRQALSSKTAKCYAGLTVLAILSVPTSFWPGFSVGFLKNVWPLAVLLAVGVLVGFNDRRIAYRSIALLTVVAGLAAAELIMGGGSTSTTNLSGNVGGAVESRAYIAGGGSTTYDANYSAAFFVMMLPYAIMFAMRKGPLRWVAIPIIPVLATAMIRTGSRGGIIAMAVLAVSTVVLSEKKDRKLQLILFACGITAMFLAPHSELMARLQALFNGSDYNFDARDGRWEVWSRGIGLMFTHPVLGVGIGAFMPANGATSGSYLDAHSAWVQISAELGVFGIGTLILLVVTAFKTIVARRRALRAAAAQGNQSPELSLDRALATAALCSLIAELTAATFLSMAYEAMTVFALTVPVALALGQRASSASAAAPAPRALRPGRPRPRQPAAAPPRVAQSRI